MTLYEAVADLTLTVESSSRRRNRRATSGGGDERQTTVFELRGAGETGRGEDVTYDAEDHEALASAPAFEFAGEYTFEEFSRSLAAVDLFPTRAPDREVFRNYRRWAVESAALDLALRQADTDLASAVGREAEPMRFVASTRLPGGDTARVHETLAVNPDCEFKLDPTSDWDDEVVADLAATDAVRVLDLKGQYEGTSVDQAADPDLYRRVVEGFPDAVVEDPKLSPETEPVVEPAADRLSWDAPIHGLDDVLALPYDPEWLNVKPSRFGTVESLFETVEHCEREGVTMYGGGQYELGVGRGHVQLLASVFYPDGPNDVAPPVYNDPEVPDDLPRSPLAPPTDPRGLDWPGYEQ
jgi:hypothetical protein